LQPSSSPTRTYVTLTITIRGLRDCAGSDSGQAAEITFYDLYGNTVHSHSATNPGGDNPNSQFAYHLIDGKVSRKWNDRNLDGCKQSSTLVFEVQENVMGFAFTTANDFIGRDPTVYDISVCPHDIFCDQPLKHIEMNAPTARLEQYPVTTLLQCEVLTVHADKVTCFESRLERVKYDLASVETKTAELNSKAQELTKSCTEARDLAVDGTCSN